MRVNSSRATVLPSRGTDEKGKEKERKKRKRRKKEEEKKNARDSKARANFRLPGISFPCRFRIEMKLNVPPHCGGIIKPSPVHFLGHGG